HRRGRIPGDAPRGGSFCRFPSVDPGRLLGPMRNNRSSDRQYWRPVCTKEARMAPSPLGASDSISVITIWIALAALAVPALEQGLRPEREVERYQQYRSAVRAILDRFDDSESQAEKIQIMEEMERLCFDELRNFLITNERARFVL